MNMDERLIEDAITEKTKVIVPVHYAGVGCAMDEIMDIAKRHNLKVVEDAAQGVYAYYKGKALGTIGDFGCFSFHSAKCSRSIYKINNHSAKFFCLLHET